MGDGMSVKDRVARWIAERLPRRVIYFAVVRAWNETTKGRYHDTDPISASAILSRLHVIMRDE